MNKIKIIYNSKDKIVNYKRWDNEKDSWSDLSQKSKLLRDVSLSNTCFQDISFKILDHICSEYNRGNTGVHIDFVGTLQDYLEFEKLIQNDYSENKITCELADIYKELPLEVVEPIKEKVLVLKEKVKKTFVEPIKLFIVYSKGEMACAEYLLQLISLVDDVDEEIIGCPDGSIEACIWTAEEYENNSNKLSGKDKILFIGDSKPGLRLLSYCDIKYDEHTIKYGWLGGKAVLIVPEKGRMTKEDYIMFKNGSISEEERFNNFIADVKVIALGGLLGPTFLLPGGIKLFDELTGNKHIESELYRFAVLHFYMNAIREFTGV